MRLLGRSEGAAASEVSVGMYDPARPLVKLIFHRIEPLCSKCDLLSAAEHNLLTVPDATHWHGTIVEGNDLHHVRGYQCVVPGESDRNLVHGAGPK